MEEDLISDYVINGPEFLRRKLGVGVREWRVIFDYLVFEHDLLVRTVNASLNFFVGEFTSYGASHVREILDILPADYDSVWEEVLKLLFNAYCRNNFAELTFEHSISGFVHLVNCARVHRIRR